MIEHLFVALLGTFALGLITWHIVHVIHKGSLFESFREWLEYVGSTWETGEVGLRSKFFYWWWKGWDCRLCFHTEVATALTWGTLVVGLLVERSILPPAEWGFAFAVGPFLTGAWAEVIRRIERIEVPD